MVTDVVFIHCMSQESLYSIARIFFLKFPGFFVSTGGNIFLLVLVVIAGHIILIYLIVYIFSKLKLLLLKT